MECFRIDFPRSGGIALRAEAILQAVDQSIHDSRQARRPMNDVTLRDISSSVAAMLKAAVARCLIEQERA